MGPSVFWTTQQNMSIAGNKNELACVYAALILHDDGIDITADKINDILKAAGVTVDPYWPSLFAKLCEKSDVGAMISAVGSAPAAGGAAPTAKREEVVEEEEEEEMGFDLFD